MTSDLLTKNKIGESSAKNLYVLCLCLYLMCLPLGILSLGSVGSALRFVALLPVGAALLFSRKVYFSAPLVLQTLFTGLCFISAIWSINSEASLSRTLSYVLLLLLLISASMFKYTSKDISYIKMALVWSSRLTAIAVFAFADLYQGRLIIREDSFTEDPNYLCAYFAFGAVFALSVILSKGSIFKKLFCLAELCVYLYIVLASGSRGGLIAILAGLFVYVLFFGNLSRANILKKICIVLAILLILALIIGALPENIRNRFTIEDVVSSGGTGRLDIWHKYLKEFKDFTFVRLLLGYGTASSLSLFENLGYIDIKGAHNILIETLVELGFVGLVLYCISIFAFSKKAFNQTDKFAFSVFFSIFVLNMSIASNAFKPYFHIMLFILVCSNLMQGESHEQN